eukprot:Amastigsp_a508398_29.p7 type:complete len:100 gc:universal Amastigsp_a508398_29:1917-2216(+)
MPGSTAAQRSTWTPERRGRGRSRQPCTRTRAQLRCPPRATESSEQRTPCRAPRSTPAPGELGGESLRPPLSPEERIRLRSWTRWPWARRPLRARTPSSR